MGLSTLSLSSVQLFVLTLTYIYIYMYIYILFGVDFSITKINDTKKKHQFHLQAHMFS